MFRTILGTAAIAGLLAASSIPALALDKGAVENQFRAWLESDIWPAAKAAGVSRATFDAALSGVKLNWKLPDLAPPGEKPQTPKKQHQAEFGSPGAYFNAKTVDAAVSGGRARAGQFKKALAAAERKYGVPAAIQLAVWGRESGYGTVKIPYNAFEVLGTKAFMATRKDMFREELLAALVIVEKGHIPATAMKSSWAGALGQPQFMPKSYLEHAADGDGDGRADIWTSSADTLASIARYLKDYGWQVDRGWAYEVTVPAAVSCSLEGPDQGKRFIAWQKLGIERVNGQPFPAGEMQGEGYLMMPAGRNGPAFLATPNFYVLKEYNTSDLYALFIGHVADRIGGAGAGFSVPWGAVGGLMRSDVAGLQRALEKLGHDVGGADGLPGYKTRRSIGRWQEARGMKATCFPDSGLVKAIR